MNSYLFNRKFESVILGLGIFVAVLVGLSYASDGTDRQIYTSQITPVSTQIDKPKEIQTEPETKKTCGYLRVL